MLLTKKLLVIANDVATICEKTKLKLKIFSIIASTSICSKKPEKPKAQKIPENCVLNNLENFWKETNNKPKYQKKAKIVYINSNKEEA